MSYFKTDEKERVGEILLECSDVSRTAVWLAQTLTSPLQSDSSARKAGHTLRRVSPTRSFSVFDGNNLTFRVEMGMDAFARSALLVPVKN